ncbi:MAG: hypothetical protein HY819_06525 [Acidobacteria bacterium]|nr:hypothetical protein [Acidobacteriota bacterium]
MSIDKIKDFDLVRTNYIIFKLKDLLKVKQETIPHRWFNNEAINSVAYNVSDKCYLSMHFFHENNCRIGYKNLYTFSDLVLLPGNGDITNEIKPAINELVNESRDISNYDVDINNKVKRVIAEINFYTYNSPDKIAEKILAEFYPYTDTQAISIELRRVLNFNLYTLDVEFIYPNPTDNHIVIESLKALPDLAWRHN